MIAALQEIAWTIGDEFSDLPDAEQATRIVIRLAVAAVLGGVIGFEREQKGKSAGLKTHMLVAMGAALFVLIPQQAGMSDADLSRVLQGLLAGVGFLGAGSIIKGNNGEEISGLTTAASIWLAAAIGVATGLGHESSALLSTLMALLILYAVPRFASRFERRPRPEDDG